MPEQPQKTIGKVTFTIEPAMKGLFQTEVETNTAILNDGLLVLENNPTATDTLEALMRAAHSIKGASRVVNLEGVVKIAHVMEDCFVMAQKGEVTFISDQIDILLQGVDMLTRISETLTLETAFTEDFKEEIDHLVASLASILKGETMTPMPPTDTAKSTEKPLTSPTDDAAKRTSTPSPDLSLPAATEQTPPPKKVPHSTLDSTSPPKKSEEKDRMVRVTAAKVERLMGLAGEVVVNARWLAPFSDSLLELKRNHVELSGTLEKLQEILRQTDERAFKLLGSAKEKTKECIRGLAERSNQLDIFVSNTATHSDRLYHEVIGVRMRPFSDGVQGYPRMVRDLAKELGKKVHFEIVGKSTEVDQDIQEKLDAPLNHLLRNAIDHGIETPEERLAAGKPETGHLRIEVGHRSGMLMIIVTDDGRGIDLNQLRQKILDKGLASAEMVNKLTEPELMDFLFLPGFSTATAVTNISGRGVGLDVVHNMVHEVGGVLRAVSTFGKGISFYLELPLTLSVIRTFLVEINHEPY
jgi:two-component system sensor histidine kinase and response regulator WspE